MPASPPEPSIKKAKVTMPNAATPVSEETDDTIAMNQASTDPAHPGYLALHTGELLHAAKTVGPSAFTTELSAELAKRSSIIQAARETPVSLHDKREPSTTMGLPETAINSSSDANVFSDQL